MRYKAYLEFIDYGKLRITTPFRQEVIDLHEMKEKDLRCDLCTLKLSKNRAPVYFSVCYGEGTIDEKYSIRVNVLRGKVNGYNTEKLEVDGHLKYTVEGHLP